MYDSKDMTYLKVSVLSDLIHKAGLSYGELNELIGTTDILSFMDDCYFTMHQQGAEANLEMLRDYLSQA